MQIRRRPTHATQWAHSLIYFSIDRLRWISVHVPGSICSYPFQLKLAYFSAVQLQNIDTFVCTVYRYVYNTLHIILQCAHWQRNKAHSYTLSISISPVRLFYILLVICAGINNQFLITMAVGGVRWNEHTSPKKKVYTSFQAVRQLFCSHFIFTLY